MRAAIYVKLRPAIMLGEKTRRHLVRWSLERPVTERAMSQAARQAALLREQESLDHYYYYY